MKRQAMVLSVVVTICASAPLAAQEARAPTPQSIQEWAGKILEDYPAAAVRAGEEGTVHMRIVIGAHGRVVSCSVTGSSGSKALDKAACQGMARYARYNPALNERGELVSATLDQAIRYVLPEGAGSLVPMLPAEPVDLGN